MPSQPAEDTSFWVLYSREKTSNHNGFYMNSRSCAHSISLYHQIAGLNKLSIGNNIGSIYFNLKKYTEARDILVPTFHPMQRQNHPHGTASIRSAFSSAQDISHTWRLCKLREGDMSGWVIIRKWLLLPSSSGACQSWQWTCKCNIDNPLAEDLR